MKCHWHWRQSYSLDRFEQVERSKTVLLNWHNSNFVQQVLRECLNTVPGDEAAIQKLLEYGLQETDLNVLDLLERDENEGRLVKMNRAWHNSATDAYLSEEEQAERKEAEEQQLISRISWDNLTVSQKELLAQRYEIAS